MAEEFRLARKDELAGVFDLCARAFARGTASDWAAGHERDPWRDEGNDLVAVSDGRVVAAVRVLARRMAGTDGEVRLAGFGNVACDPQMRRHGYVRRLLALAHERNQSAGYDLALLFTTQPWIYAGSAGSVLPFPWLEVDLGRVPLSAAAGEWTIEPADPPRHLSVMRGLYDQFGLGRPGYPLRGEAYWTHPARLTDSNWIRIAFDHDGRLPRDHVASALGNWKISEDAMARAYTSSGAQLIAAIGDRTVYWSGDGF